MDPKRYAQVRDLFLAVDELPRDQQLQYLTEKAGGDQELIAEVLSLLDEHDADHAKIEGDSAKAPAFPSANSETLPETGAGSSSAPSPTSLTDTETGSTSDPGLSPSSAASAAPFLPNAASQSSAAEKKGRESGVSKRRKRTKKSVSNQPSTRKGLPGSGSETQHGSQRTHASPRYKHESKRQRTNAGSKILESRARRQQRSNSGWLWLAAILPTALIGIWTYYQVTSSLRQAVENELIGVADSVQHTVQRYLDDKAKLAESWSRQVDVRHAVQQLVELAGQPDAIDRLKNSEHSETIKQQLIAMSETPDIKYVVWDRSGMIIASWLPDKADIGGNVSPEGAGNLHRALRGETILYGPEILQAEGTGFVPETALPVMAEIIPIRDDQDRIIAAMLLRGIGIFQDFDQIFQQASSDDSLDVYAVNHDGTMISNSLHATSLLTQNVLALESEFVACKLRVSDPGVELTRGTGLPRPRRSQPLTYSVVGASSGGSGERLDDYRNYTGSEVIGAWRWIDNWDIGVVVERNSKSAFAAAEIVRFGFLTLSVLLTITALVTAARIAQRTAEAQAAVHPLSRYELVSELGNGGMGVVYRAKHNQLGRDTALKVLRGDRDHEEDRLRFDREAKLAASLSSPHTVTIYDYGRSDEGEAYCVMEFLKGITLYDAVARSGYQDYGRSLFILRQICDSLGEAHGLGLVHRDVKPQNVMLSLDPSVGDWAVVFDFGLAKPLQPDSDAYQTAETVWAGTPMYMAPERYREPNKIDPRSDIYSVGCVAYFLLTGRPPFIECDPESLFALVLTEEPISLGVHRDEKVPEEIVSLVKKCMAKSMDDRYQTIDELESEIDNLIQCFPWGVDEARSWWRIHGEEIA